MNNKWAKGFIMGFFAAVTGILIGLYFSSCQPPPDPLKNAEFPCIVTKRGFAYRMWIECQDKPYKFADEGYLKAFKEKDTIYKPLNKN